MAHAANRVIAENGDLGNERQPEQGRAARRTFTTGFKLGVLEEWDRCDSAADRSAILRREGIYSSTIADWKRQRREGRLAADGARHPDGRGGPSYAEVDRLRRQNQRLEEELAKARFVIEVQGKVHALLEELSKSADSDTNET